MKDTDCTLEQAMERVYNSSLMPALQDEENELYIQSPAYLYEMMNAAAASNANWWQKNDGMSRLRLNEPLRWRYSTGSLEHEH